MTEYGSTIAHERSIDRRDDQVKGFVKNGTVVDVIPNDVSTQKGEQWFAGDGIAILE